MSSFNVTKNGLLKGRFPIFAKSQVLLYPLLSYSCFGKISAVASILYNISYDKGKGFYVQIHEALQLATTDSNFTCGCNIYAMDVVEAPPTYFRTNWFTNAFWEIVETYGYVNIRFYV